MVCSTRSRPCWRVSGRQGASAIRETGCRACMAKRARRGIAAAAQSRATQSRLMDAVRHNSAVEADVALSRCAPSGPRSLTPVVRPSISRSGRLVQVTAPLCSEGRTIDYPFCSALSFAAHSRPRSVNAKMSFRSCVLPDLNSAMLRPSCLRTNPTARRCRSSDRRCFPPL